MKFIRRKRHNANFIVLLSAIVQILLCWVIYKSGPYNKISVFKDWNIIRQMKNWTTSIAFYTILGAGQHIDPNHDLRGKFWEYQLKDFHHNYSTHYIADGPINITGIDVMVLPPNLTPGMDMKLCMRTHASWIHFIDYNPSTKWYYRGTHDSFIRIKNLEKMLFELEKKLDPMKEWGLVYNCHEYGHKLYPHGGTGYIFSNYAIRKFLENGHQFLWECKNSADDIELGYFIEHFGLNVEDYISNKFVVTYPNTQLNVIKDWDFSPVKTCPKFYRLYRGGPKMKPCTLSDAVSIHMHKVPMDEAAFLLDHNPDSLFVTFLNPNTPAFCWDPGI